MKAVEKISVEDRCDLISDYFSFILRVSGKAFRYFSPGKVRNINYSIKKNKRIDVFSVEKGSFSFFTFFYINRRKYWFRANFRFPVFDGFTRFGMF